MKTVGIVRETEVSSAAFGGSANAGTRWEGCRGMLGGRIRGSAPTCEHSLLGSGDADGVRRRLRACALYRPWSWLLAKTACVGAFSLLGVRVDERSQDDERGLAALVRDARGFFEYSMPAGQDTCLEIGLGLQAMLVTRS